MSLVCHPNTNDAGSCREAAARNKAKERPEHRTTTTNNALFHPFPQTFLERGKAFDTPYGGPLTPSEVR